MMGRGPRFAAIAAAGALAMAAPAAAKPGHAKHASHPAHPSQPGTSRKCTAHEAAYIASGQFVSRAATQSANGTWTGTITVHVTRSNHHAASAKGTDVTYPLSNTKVTFGEGGNPPAAGDPVKVIGKVSDVAKKCTQSGSSTQITVRKVHIRAAKSRPTGSREGVSK
jgi:hypothetical protein